MISTTRQDFSAGSTVKIGFMSLVVMTAIATPGDGLPDAYILKNAAGTKLYKFVPHNGLESISLLEARELIAAQAAHAKQVADRLIEQARRDAVAVAAINDLIFA